MKFSNFFPFFNADPAAGGGGVPTLLDAPASAAQPPAGGEPAPAGAPTPIITAPADRDWSQAVMADGSFDPMAHEWGIPEHMTSVGGMLESYQNLQRMKGTPGAEGTAEQIATYRQANGIPEVVNAEAYGLSLPDDIKESFPEGALDSIAQVANETAHLGHTEMLKAVVGKFSEMEIAGQASNAEATEAGRAAKMAESAKILEADPNFAGERRTAALQTTANTLNNALNALGVDPSSEDAKEIARSPLMIRVLHNLGSRMSQDSTNLGNPATDLRGGEEQADDIISNPNNPEHKLFHSGDERVGKKVIALMGQ